MIEETIETISETTDIKHLVDTEYRMSYNISLLENKNTIKGSIRKKLVDEANKYGVPSLDEYINIKKFFYLSIKEACINRLIELNRDTSSRSSTSSIAI